MPLTPDTLIERERKRSPSYVSPWSLHVFPDDEITKRIAQVDRKTITAVAEGIHESTAGE